MKIKIPKVRLPKIKIPEPKLPDLPDLDPTDIIPGGILKDYLENGTGGVELGLKALKDAVEKGDFNAAKQFTGRILLDSPNCLGCRMYSETILPNHTPEEIETLVGTGVFIFAETGDVVFTAIEVGKQLIIQTVLSDEEEEPPFQQPDVGDTAMHFSSSADCIIEVEGKGVWAAWKNPPVFTDSSGSSYTFPNVDITGEDTVNLTASRCPEQERQNGVVSLESAAFHPGDFDVTPSDTPERLKYFLRSKQ